MAFDMNSMSKSISTGFSQFSQNVTKNVEQTKSSFSNSVTDFSSNMQNNFTNSFNNFSKNMKNSITDMFGNFGKMGTYLKVGAIIVIVIILIVVIMHMRYNYLTGQSIIKQAGTVKSFKANVGKGDIGGGVSLNK